METKQAGCLHVSLVKSTRACRRGAGVRLSGRACVRVHACIWEREGEGRVRTQRSNGATEQRSKRDSARANEQSSKGGDKLSEQHVSMLECHFSLFVSF